MHGIPNTSSSAATSTKPRRRLKLNIRMLMGQHDYRSVTELFRDVGAAGCDISYSQFRRLVDNETVKWNTTVLDVLLNLFQCEITDLFRTVDDDTPAAPARRELS